uniref:Uncharacterized protein n=1 Tax=Anguilla anguilla TaxID=7936 RepID=A0A0E9WVH9_ANGAN
MPFYEFSVIYQTSSTCWISRPPTPHPPSWSENSN